MTEQGDQPDETRPEATADGGDAIAPPPPLAPPGPPARSSRRPLLIALGVVLVGTMAAAVVVARSGGGEPDPDEALGRAAAAMESAESFRLRATSVDTSTTGEEGGAGSSTEYRTVTEAVISGDEWRATTDSGDYADETVGLADSLYSRSADSVDGLADEQWALLPANGVDEVTALAEDDPQAAFLMVTGLDFDGDGEIDVEFDDDEAFLEEALIPGLADYYLFGLGEPSGLMGPAPVPLPSGFVDAFGSFEDAEVVADDGETLTIRATRHVPAEIADGIDLDLPPGVFEITLGADDLPTKLTLTVDGTSAHRSEEVTFSDWGAEITIGVPEGEVDETPWVDEEAVAAAAAVVTPMAPTVVPDGLVISYIEGYTAEELDESCPQLNIGYWPPIEDTAAAEAFTNSPDYLDIYLLPADCAQASDPTPFEAGEFGDVPSRESELALVEVLIGDTVVQFDTTYQDELPAMVASIAPFDLDAALATISTIGEQQMSEGGITTG